MSTKFYTEADLIAYLDNMANSALGEAIDRDRQSDSDLADRLTALTMPVSRLTDAFSPEALDAPSLPDAVVAHRAASHFGWSQAGALAASFALGAILMFTMRPGPDWTDAVASYQALYATETLADARQTDAESIAIFDRAAASLGVDLNDARVIEGLAFKRAQMLIHEGTPLIQMAYLDADGTPFAFCATRVGGQDSTPRSFVSHGLAATSWTSDGIGYILVGGTDTENTAQLAAPLTETF